MFSNNRIRALIAAAALLAAVPAAANQIFITAGTTWTVPADWNNAANTIELIGGGGAGCDEVTGNSGAGGGGGEHRILTNQTYTPGNVITVAIGTGGTNSCPGGNGGITTIKDNANSTVIGQANGGTGGSVSTGGVGGTGGTGGTGHAGGAGSAIGGGGWGSGAGGAAGNATAIGGAGGTASALSTTNSSGPGGGGSGTNAGSAGGSLAGGNGGAGQDTTAGGTGGSGAGTSGGGASAHGAGGGGGAGGGASNTDGGAGGVGGLGNDWDASHGSGGGGGGGGAAGFSPNLPGKGGAGGLYGGGGGGSGGASSSRSTVIAGLGAQGIIRINYTPSAGPSPKVLILLRQQPIITLDFANGTYTGCPGGISGCLVVARTGTTATNLLPSSASGASYTTYAANTPRFGAGGAGLLVEESRQNFLLNSAVPATQTTGSLSNSASLYVLWVNGAGSATVSAGTATGCGAGVATQGNPVTFTITVTGTCVITVAGALNAFQLERQSATTGGSSLIVTAGASITRPADVVTAVGPLQTLLRPGASGTALVQASQFSAFSPPNQSTFLAANGTTSIFLQVQASNAVQANLGSGTNGIATLGNSKTWVNYAVKSAVAWDTAGFSAVGAGGTVSNQAHAPSYTAPFYIGSRAGTAVFLDWTIAKMTFWATRLPDAQLQQVTYP